MLRRVTRLFPSISQPPVPTSLPFRNPLFPLSKPDQRIIQQDYTSTECIYQSRIHQKVHPKWIHHYNYVVKIASINFLSIRGLRDRVYLLINVMDDRPNKPPGRLSRRLVEPWVSPWYIAFSVNRRRYETRSWNTVTWYVRAGARDGSGDSSNDARLLVKHRGKAP